MRLVIFLLILILTMAIPLAAAENKKTKKSGDDRGLTLVEKTRVTGKRVALVIGNSDYRYCDSLRKLTNPVNDADDIAVALERFGFNVVKKKNLTREELDESVANFGRMSANSDAALFYYAGHGMQIKGQNFLVPVDAKITSDTTETQASYRLFNISQLLEEMDNSKSRVKLVMLDACRDNPISGKFRGGGVRGLAAPAALPKGTVIVYATDPGNVAADGNGRNGIFTAAMLSAFNEKDLSLGGVLYNASKQVQVASNQEQTPYINGPATVQREFYFMQPPPMTDLFPPPEQSKTILPEQIPVSSDNSKKSTTLLKEKVQINPDHLQTHRDLAAIYKKENKLNELEKEYREILRLKKDDSETRNALTAIYVKNKNYAELITLLKENVEMTPQDTNQHYKLGLVYEFQKDFTNAAASYQEAIKLKDDNAKALNALGRVNMKTGNIKDAKKYLEKAKAADPNLEETILLLNNIRDEASTEPKKTAKKAKKTKSSKVVSE